MIVCSLDQIKEAWAEYGSKTVLKILKDGKWKMVEMPKGGLKNISATKASVVKIKDVMSFPKFLETVYHG